MVASRPLLLFASLHGLASAQHTYPSRYTALWNSPWPADCQAGGVPPRWSDYNISTNRNSSFRGQTVATIYKAGNYPMFRGMGPGGACADGDWNCTAATSVFGGLPQLANLTSHLEQLALDVAAILPDPAWSGVANIDWEAWSPEYANNRYNEYWIYVNRSEALVRQQQPAWPASQRASKPRATEWTPSQSVRGGCVQRVELLEFLTVHGGVRVAAAGALARSEI